VKGPFSPSLLRFGVMSCSESLVCWKRFEYSSSVRQFESNLYTTSNLSMCGWQSCIKGLILEQKPSHVTILWPELIYNLVIYLASAYQRVDETLHIHSFKHLLCKRNNEHSVTFEKITEVVLQQT
jgi:hypothetical protein